MDPMKANDPRPNVIIEPQDDKEEITGEVITERDENGKPVAGRYPMREEPILDIDDGEKGFQLTGPQERMAENMAVDKLTTWMKGHPNYTMDELKEQKAVLLREARTEVTNGITQEKPTSEIRKEYSEATLEHQRYVTGEIMRLKNNGWSNAAIAERMNIPESTVRFVLSTHAEHAE